MFSLLERKKTTTVRAAIPGLGKSPGEGNSNPLQYSCLENPMDRGTQWAAVHGVIRVGHCFKAKPPPRAAECFPCAGQFWNCLPGFVNLNNSKEWISNFVGWDLDLGTTHLINCGKFWKRWEYQTTWFASWETYMQVRKQQLELDMEQQTGSK